MIDGGTFTRAAGVDNKWHTVENFGTMTFNGGKVIAEDGQSFAIVNGWNYIDPGEQKATMTINNIEMKAGPNGLKNCAGGTLTMNGAHYIVPVTGDCPMTQPVLQRLTAAKSFLTNTLPFPTAVQRWRSTVVHLPALREAFMCSIMHMIQS